MCEAGIAFYDKVRQKNQAIRELFGEDIYEKNGDTPRGFLQLNMFTLTESKRQEYLQIRLKEYQTEQKSADQEASENATAESQ